MFTLKKSQSVKRTIKPEYELHGVTIRRLSVAAYLTALESINNPVQTLAEAMFPNHDVEEILASFERLKNDDKVQTVISVLLAAPKPVLQIVCRITGIPERRVLEDVPDALTPLELVEILTAFWERNDLTDFFGKGRKLIGVVTARKTMKTTGSSE